MNQFNIKAVESVKEFDGFLTRYQHDSQVCQCSMQFSVYLPNQASSAPVHALYWLSGLTCSDDNFRTKAGAQRYAAELGLALIIPDTSPRGEAVPDDDNYDFGQAAGFYLNATQSPWDTNFQMYDYITQELPQVLQALNLPLTVKQSISGHSMGGHGALTIGLKNPDLFTSVSAFSPICHPMVSPWGIKAFTGYLGVDQAQWSQYDACALIEAGAKHPALLIDQGLDDEFYPHELLSKDLMKVAQEKDVSVEVRFQEGYDHSYHFIATFIGEHMRWHQQHLNQAE